MHSSSNLAPPPFIRAACATPFKRTSVSRPDVRFRTAGGLATRDQWVRRDRKGLGPTQRDTGCDCFLRSSGCDTSGLYRLAHGTGLNPNKNQSALPDVYRLQCGTEINAVTGGGGGGGASNGQVAVSG